MWTVHFTVKTKLKVEGKVEELLKPTSLKLFLGDMD